MTEGMVISKAPEQAQAEGDEEDRDEGIDPGIGAEGDDAERSEDGCGGEAEAGEEDDDPEAEDERLHDAFPASAGLAVEEVGHRDGDHGEDAGREDGGQSEAEGHGEKGEEAFGLRGGRG